jgi:hypothetical protein
MKIISRDDRKIVIQREEFIVNLINVQTISFGGLAIMAIYLLSPEARRIVYEESPWGIGRTDETSPFFIFVGISVLIGSLIRIGEQFWQLLKSPTRKKMWDQYTFDKEQDDVSELTYKGSAPQSLGTLGEIRNIEISFDIEYKSKANDPEDSDMFPTSLYKVIATFEGDRQVLLERNAIQLASPDKVQQLFRQTLTETNQVVLELRTFLGLCSSIDE